MKRFLTFLLFAFSTHVFAQDIVVSAFLYEQNSSNPIPYATIIDITSNKYGTTSQKDGSFKLLLPKGSSNNNIYISSLGYRDTTLTISQLKESQKLFLIPVIYELADVTVTTETVEEIEIGDSTADIVKQNNLTKGYEASAGFSWGAYIKVGKKDVEGTLKSIHVYIGNTGFPKAPLSLRIFEFEGEFEFFRSQPRSKFKDILPELVILKAKKSGWFEADLSTLNIKVPESGLYCMFTPLDYGEEFLYKTAHGTKYGATIAIYSDNKSGKSIYPFIQNKDKFTVIKKTNAPTPAVSITLSRNN
ncbi:hypothetical protein [uncultured Roseivirga sp.]|uniref:hypothetical protein n=1 Tax=uncultured Roseivirga sp. TaxID=543088 RepID=UPI0030DD1C55|tara:strand:+ start:258478 stop:259386 length:909 start_codon:yes stop_codon:yes gene_type:complete